MYKVGIGKIISSRRKKGVAKMKKLTRVKLLLSVILISNMLVPVSVGAASLNDIATSNTVVQEVTTEAVQGNMTAVAYGNTPEEEAQRIKDQWTAMEDATVITNDDMTRATKLAKPVSKVIRTFIAFIMLVLSVLIGGVSALDIVCLVVSPLRRAVGTSEQGQPGGYDMTPTQTQSSGGIIDTIAKWASKDCEDAIATCTPTGGGNMGGYGMESTQSTSTKNLLMTYFKKRTFTIILSVICFIMFTGTAFTELGVKLASKLTEIILNINI